MASDFEKKIFYLFYKITVFFVNKHAKIKFLIFYFI